MRNDSPPEAERLIPTREAAAMFGYSARGLLAAARAGRFPPPVRLSRTRCAWAQSVLDAHMQQLAQEAQGEARHG
jgi:predicted DNA-binding transcriptional regulator AlpA